MSCSDKDLGFHSVVARGETDLERKAIASVPPSTPGIGDHRDTH